MPGIATIKWTNSGSGSGGPGPKISRYQILGFNRHKKGSFWYPRPQSSVRLTTQAFRCCRRSKASILHKVQKALNIASEKKFVRPYNIKQKIRKKTKKIEAGFSSNSALEKGCVIPSMFYLSTHAVNKLFWNTRRPMPNREASSTKP